MLICLSHEESSLVTAKKIGYRSVRKAVGAAITYCPSTVWLLSKRSQQALKRSVLPSAE